MRNFRDFQSLNLCFLDMIMLYWKPSKKFKQVIFMGKKLSKYFWNIAFDCKVTVLDNVVDKNIVKQLEQDGIVIERIIEVLSFLLIFNSIE